MLHDLEELASTVSQEGSQLDFKSQCDPTKAGFWCEIVKDLISFANTMGGVIVFGLNSDGSKSEDDCSSALKLDNADINNQVEKYTGAKLADVYVKEITRSTGSHPAIFVRGEKCLIPFIKPGTYEFAAGKQKTAFGQGTIYVRHGSQSEPCQREDLRKWLERELEAVREGWLSNIRAVVEAPLSHTVLVASAPSDASGATPVFDARITNSATAIPVRVRDPERDWPYRGKELMDFINRRITPAKINSHDLLSVREAYNVTERSRPDFMFKAHKHAAPQYSDAFAQWIVESWKSDPDFFTKCRTAWKMSRYPGSSSTTLSGQD